MAPADATFPGANGKIAFQRGGDIWTMNPDGTDQVNLTNSSTFEADPAWSPDGAKIAYSGPGAQSGDPSVIHMMNADGSGDVSLGPGFTPASVPVWSPDGTEIAFLAQAWSIYAMRPDGSNLRFVASSDPPYTTTRDFDWSPAGDTIAVEILCESWEGAFLVTVPAEGGSFTPLTQPGATECDQDRPYDGTSASWSPDAQRILFGSEGPPGGSYTIRPDASNRTFLGAFGDLNMVWSPGGTKIAFDDGGQIRTMNADGTGAVTIAPGTQPDWQPIPINAYPRPKGASPMQVSLVPAYDPCTAPNSTHGAPLSFSSCTPPQQASAHLTTGTPDANGRSVRMSAALTLKAVSGDVEIDAHLNDIANPDLSDYTGSLRAAMPVRITDKLNTPHPGGPGAATTQPFTYGFTIPCTSDPGPTTGSDCTLATSMNALAPGTHADGRRAVWQLGGVRVFDGGSDADGSTTADNTLFAVQGVFVP